MREFLLPVLLLMSVLLCGQTKNVLFLGNSYTQVNNLPLLTSEVAASVGDILLFESNTPGGYTLEGHSSNQSSLGKIMQGNWDFVILQEQSQRPSLPLEQVELEVFPFAYKLDSIVNKYNACAETMFYMTWGRKNGDAENCSWWPPVCTYRGMDSLLNLRYSMMAENNNAVVSPVGAVWKYINENHPLIELYSSDESHPSVAGTYAAACSFYTAIFRKDPSLLNFNSTLTQQQAEIIRNAAKIIVYDSLLKWHIGEYDLTSKFNYSSEGDLTYQFLNQSENSIEQIWDFGGTTDTAFNAVYTFPSEGSFPVSLKSFNKCDTVVSSQIIEVNITNIEDNRNTENLILFPNPVNDKLIFKMDNNTNLSVKIFNLDGEIIITYNDYSSNEIDVSGIKKGLYFIEIELGSSRFVNKFVKK
jgi:hypothetical protein